MNEEASEIEAAVLNQAPPRMLPTLPPILRPVFPDHDLAVLTREPNPAVNWLLFAPL